MKKKTVKSLQDIKLPKTPKTEVNKILEPEPQKTVVKKVNQFYDATQPTVKRRQPSIEIKNEDGILNGRQRLIGTATVRDIERNYSNAKGIITQLKANVVGSLGKMQLNTPDGKEATDFFNTVWAKECSARDDSSWSELLQLIVAARYTSGDCLILVDDMFAEDNGKIYLWESDQICNMNDEEFKVKYPNHTQDNGILRNKLGVEMGYFVCSKRGQVSAKAEEITFLPRNSIARLIKAPWRLNQGRGIGEMLTSANDLFDLYDFRSRELQSAKVAASFIGKVKRKDGVMNYDDPTDINGDPSLSDGETDGATIGGNNCEKKEEQPTYERYEALTGGLMEYMSPEDDFEIIDIQRPNVNAAEYHDHTLSSAGSAFGFSKAYSVMRADSSYTAFRGDMIMTWQSCFYPAQKWLERKVCDFVAIKVIGWAIRKGIIKPLEAGWENKISWIFPTQPEVNPEVIIAGQSAALKNGLTTYSKILGPNWKEQFNQLAEELNYAKEIGLPLAVFESGNGVPVEPIEKDPNENRDTNVQDPNNPNENSNDNEEEV